MLKLRRYWTLNNPIGHAPEWCTYDLPSITDFNMVRVIVRWDMFNVYES